MFVAWTVEASKTKLEAGTADIRTEIQLDNPFPLRYTAEANPIGWKLSAWPIEGLMQWMESIVRNLWAGTFGYNLEQSGGNTTQAYNDGVTNGLTMGLLIRK